MNSVASGETLRDALLATVTLAENDLTSFRILAIFQAVQTQLLLAALEAHSGDAGLELARELSSGMQNYLSSLDAANPAPAE